MISGRHKSNDLVTILCLGCCSLLLLLLSAAPLVHSASASAGGVFEVLAQSTASETEATTTTKTTAVTTVTATKTNASQDEVGQPQPQSLTPSATTAPRLDHNNNNEWRPLGHGDPLQKDPTYDYSPPALERVRYWAENNGTGQSNPEARKKELPPEVLRNKTKSEILLLGVASERVRVPHSHSYPGLGLGLGQHQQQQQQQQQHQQQQQQQQLAKYAAIRRSYYAPPQQQQLHQQIQQHNQQFQQQYTQKHQQHAQNPQQIHSQSQQHTPMQQHSPIQQQLLQNQHQQQPQFQQQQPPPQQHMPPTHLMPPPMMMMKAGSGSGSIEYRHSMTGGSPGSIAGSPSMSTSYMSHISHMSSPAPKQFMTSSMAYHPSYTSWHSSAPISGMSSMPPHRLSYADAHHQESMQHYSFSSRPHQTVSYSPNSLPGHLGASKASLRKPWLHELLQKEVVVKPKVKPTMPATKYLMGTSKPHQALPPAGYGISSTRPPMGYAPVTFVPGPPTIAVPTVASSLGQEIYITPTPQTSSSSGFRPMLVTSPTSSATISIPMTTPTPLPIYLRPGSSSPTTTTTTTTTNNRLLIPQTSNLAQRPTVAPAPESTTDSLFSHYKQPPKALLGPMYLIIEGHSKVKTYGQNELDPHSPKIVPVISKREPVVRIADPNEKRGTVETFQVKHLHTKTTPMTTTTPRPVTTTTERPVTSSSTSKPTQRTTTLKTTTTTTTTTTSLPPSTTPFTTPSSTAPSSPTPSASGVNDLLSLLDNMFADVHEIASSTVSVPVPKPKPNPIPASSTMSTILKPVSTRLLPQQPEPRIGTQAGSISSLLENDEAGEDLGSDPPATSTELPLRSTRQVFDYDQLPESRVSVGATATTDMEYNDDDDDDEEEEEEDELEEASFDDGAATSGSQQAENEEAEEEEEDNEYNLLKRIDRFVDDVDDGEDDLEDLIEERRQQH
ncbi:mucin-5AC [Drosophila obscura]|uniref:mucin-5AC n=1 Tax=Drosophila obscura TaxID=7282 RepID=UPI001BB106B4|nr:mucin-5AC [Drosophila obscura]